MNDEMLWSEFARLGEPGSLGEESSDEELLAGLFDERERAAYEAHTTALGLTPRESTDEPRNAAPEPRRRWAPVAALGLFALACAVLLSLGSSSPDLSVRGKVLTPEPGASAAMASTPEQPTRWAHPGEHHRLREADCRRLADDLRVCSPKAASFRVSERSTAAKLELELESGELELDGEAESLESLRLRTAVGQVIVHDPHSRFRVVYDDVRRRLDVEVSAGEVAVERDDGERVSLGAGAHFGLAAQADAPTSVPTKAELEAPPDRDPVVPPKPKPSAVQEPAPVVVTPEQLLGAAQRELAGGHRSAALRAYRSLVDRFPTSAEARTARVSLGRLLLADGDVEAALAEFEQYIAQDQTRALLEEARYGRIRCLRALGREPQLRAAIDEFVTRHPSSLHRERVESWRAEPDESPAP